MQRTLQGQVRQARMIVRAAAERPVEFGICRLDWDIVMEAKRRCISPAASYSQFSLPYERNQFPLSSCHSYA